MWTVNACLSWNEKYYVTGRGGGEWNTINITKCHKCKGGSLKLAQKVSLIFLNGPHTKKNRRDQFSQKKPAWGYFKLVSKSQMSKKSIRSNSRKSVYSDPQKKSLYLWKTFRFKFNNQSEWKKLLISKIKDVALKFVYVEQEMLECYS